MAKITDRPRRVAEREKAPDVQLRLLGGFEMTAEGQHCDVSISSQRLLVYLALRRNAQDRTVVAASLWPNHPEQRAYANLRASLWRLPTPGGFALVESVGTQIHLAERLDVDVRVTEAIGWALVDHPGQAIDHLDPEAFLVELLPGWYDDWVLLERERIAQLQLRFLEALTYALIDRNRLTRALDVALRLVNVDPLREGSQRALLTVYRAEGSFGQAARQFEGYRLLIRQTFGCEPSPDLRDLATGPFR